MNLMAPRYAIFDFDGTLADTQNAILRTFEAAARQIGLEQPDEKVVISTIGLALKDSFAIVFKGIDSQTIDRTAECFRSLLPSVAFPLIVPFEGIHAALDEIASLGVRMFVATSRSHTSLDYLAEKTGVSKYFEELFGAEDVIHNKPAPDLILKIQERFGINPAESVMIGDTVFDLQMGKAAGCKVCGVSWGNQSHEKLLTENPQWVLDNIEQLPGIFK